MQRPPRNLKDKLFDRKSLIRSLLQGLSVLFFVLIVFLLALEGSILKTFNSQNRALWMVVGGALLSLVLVLYVPTFRELFHFSVLHFDDLITILIGGIVSAVWIILINIKLK